MGDGEPLYVFGGTLIGVTAVQSVVNVRIQAMDVNLGISGDISVKRGELRLGNGVEKSDGVGGGYNAAGVKSFLVCPGFEGGGDGTFREKFRDDQGIGIEVVLVGGFTAVCGVIDVGTVFRAGKVDGLSGKIGPAGDAEHGGVQLDELSGGLFAGKNGEG